jgi:hypothetical protein
MVSNLAAERAPHLMCVLFVARTERGRALAQSISIPQIKKFRIDRLHLPAGGWEGEGGSRRRASHIFLPRFDFSAAAQERYSDTRIERWNIQIHTYIEQRIRWPLLEIGWLGGKRYVCSFGFC